MVIEFLVAMFVRTMRYLEWILCAIIFIPVISSQCREDIELKWESFLPGCFLFLALINTIQGVFDDLPSFFIAVASWILAIITMIIYKPSVGKY